MGTRQRACGNPDGQTVRRQKTQADCATVPAPLNQLPWNVAQDQLGSHGADFIGVMNALIIRATKDQIRRYLTETTALPHSGNWAATLSKLRSGR